MSMGTVSADPGIIYVNNAIGNDSYNGQSPVYNSVTRDGPKLSIKNATGTVTPNGIVNIAKGLYTGKNNRNIQIDRNMTLIGGNQKGTIINAEHMGRIFTIQPGVLVNIQNLTLVNGTSNDGGAIYNAGTLNIKNITFNNNTANNDSGGAIFNYDGSNLSVTGCTFTGNTATYGGAICNYNYSILRSLSDRDRRMQITSVFNGVYSSLTVTDCRFTGNTASYYGGAITSDNYGNLTVTNCNFTNNIAERYGGAINNDFYSIANIKGCILTGNAATEGSGGAIDNYYYGTCNVTNSTFTSNTANYGGAICNDDYGPLTVIRCIFTSNSANLDGGAINDDDDSFTTVKNSVFNGNTANGSGGAIDNYHSTLTISNSTFNGNQGRNGGALNNYYGTVTITGSVLTNNSASGSCGGIYNYGGNLVAHFNRIHNGSLPYNGIWNERNGSVNAEYNWWGSNENPASQAYNVTIYRWIILVMSADPTEIYHGEKSNITASFNWFTDGNRINPLDPEIDGHLADGTPVIFTSTLGSISRGPVDTINGAATTVLNADQTAGTAYISGLIDVYTVFSTAPYVKLLILKAPAILNVNNKSSYLGNKINLTATLKDHKGKGVAGKTIIFSIGNGGYYSASTDKNGLATYTGYNIKQNPGTYIITATFKGDASYQSGTNTATLSIKPSANLNFTITVRLGPYYYGNMVHYRLKVENKGPNTATGVSIFDKLPSGLKYQNSSSNKGFYKLNTNIWTIGTLKIGQTAILGIKAIMNKTGSIVNTATLTQTTYPHTPKTKSVRITISSTITIPQMIKAARQVKTYYESHHTLPSNVVISKRTLNMPQFLQILVTATQNINMTHLNSIKVQAANKPTSPGGSYISSNLYRKEYLNVARNIKNFISTRGRAPNYAKTSLGKIPFSKLVYMYSKIINFYGLKNRLPNYVKI